MGKWNFLILSAGIAGAAHAADPPVSGTAASGISGSATYPANANKGAGAGGRPSITVPTPDTIPPPGAATGNATGTIPVNAGEVKSLGRFRNAKGEVKIEGMIHDRYKQSVVRVVAKDLAGNTLAKAMGVAVGRNSQYIATSLSIVLGTSQQWADKIEITHYAGNKYFAQVALVDEEKNLVLLVPEASPAPIVFAREGNERPQIDVFTITFDPAPDGSLASSVNRGRLAAANPETGLLSVSPYKDYKMDDSQAGTGIIDSEGSLVGMLLPGGRGVLASTLQRAVAKAQKLTPIEPRMIGVILGRGVLVDPRQEGAFKTINEALDAIRKGTAPKTDTTRYTPARNRAVAPKETDKVVIKVMPGTYKEKKQISLPSHVSLSGSGPGQTVILTDDPNKPVILVQNASNVMIAGFRIAPAPLQTLKAPSVIVSKSSRVTLLGNVLEAKGGVAAWVHQSKHVAFFGNTFARGTVRGLSCDRSNIELEANAFVGDWPVALSIDRDCAAEARRNLFFENKSAVAVSANSGRVALNRNTFVRSSAAVKLAGAHSRFSLQDNIFFECAFGLFASSSVSSRSLGRNGAWRSKFVSGSQPITMIDLVKTEPKFRAPDVFDFRIQPGKGHSGNSVLEEGADLGAYQPGDFLGEYSGPLARSLGVAASEDDLAEEWGITD